MDSICEYKFADKAFYAVTGDKEKVVAHLDGGKVVYEKGCAGPHKERLTAWIKEQGISFENEQADGSPGTGEAVPSLSDMSDKSDVSDMSDESRMGTRPGAGETGDDSAAWIVENIPAGELPEFDLMLGVATPGFEEFVKAHHIEGSARVALVKRLEKLGRQ